MKKITKYIYPFIIFILVLFLSIRNFSPHTFLTGWDTLHPELNFSLNFERIWNGVWRANQGLGALAGHSHMADLPRVAILYLLSFLAPLNALRYLYVFLCLLIGPLGVFYLVRHLLHRFQTGHTHEDKKELSVGKVSLFAFLGSLFYLFNLSTVQQFYAPFEMFTTQYALLPWVVFTSLIYLKDDKSHKKHLSPLLLFSVVSLFSTPQAYAAHLWYPFIVVYSLFLFLYGFFHKQHSHSEGLLKRFKKPFVLLVLTLAINAYWLLPNLYFIATSSSVPKESKQNRIFSQEYRLRNRENGYLPDVALMKGFYFNWTSYNFKENRFEFLMPKWRTHVQNPFVQGIGYLLFVLVVIGIVQTVRKKKKEFLPYLPFVVLPFLFLMNNTPPFSWFFDFLLRISLFEEALRFVYTKFSILILFGYAVYLVLGLLYVSDLFQFKLKQVSERVVMYGLSAIFVITLLIYAFPMFQGQLIGPQFKVNIPQEYFALWNYMKDKDKKTVLTLPLHTFSGWQYYKWGYQGAGFIWFGLPQPVLDRDSDRWNIANEQSFREFQYALYAQRSDAFVNALSKYSVGYIIWDKNVISPSIKNQNQITYVRETKMILDNLVTQDKLRKEKVYGDIEIYTVISARNVVSGENQIIHAKHSVTPTYRWTSLDSAFELFGNYITDKNSDTVFPFRNLFLPSDRVIPGIFSIQSSKKNYSITAQLHSAAPVTVPDLQTVESTVFTHVYVRPTNKAQNEYILRFEPVLPSGIAQPFEQSVIFNSSETNTYSFTVNTNPLSVTFNPDEVRSWAYAGETYLYTSNQNYINGVGFQSRFTPKKNTVLPPYVVLEYPLSSIVYPANKIVVSANDRNSITIAQGINNPIASFKTERGQNGAYLPMDNIPHDLGYALIIQSRNLQGLPIRICLKNLYSNICTLYDELSRSKDFVEDYFIIPPMEPGIGYSLSLDNISLGNAPSRNEIKQITLLPIAYNLLSHLYYNSSPQEMSKSIEVLSNNEAFHSGWSAYVVPRSNMTATATLSSLLPSFFGTQLTDHVLVNNWANGWVLDNTSITSASGSTELRYCSSPASKNGSCSPVQIVTVFWPQYLEYLGFILIGGLFLLIILSSLRSRHKEQG